MSDNNGMQKLTPEQEAAVKHRGGALLVSAAAGSGKTKVLVERLLSRIEAGDDINEFLIITYTRAAAAELRERIYEEILIRLSKSPGNRRLRRQSMLCRGAQIGTIHSFCTDILRENAHIVGLSPDFRIIDESESDMIKAEVVEAVLDNAYEKESNINGFQTMMDIFTSGRNDWQLIQAILDIHRRLQSSPDLQSWVTKQCERLRMTDVKDISETIWGELLLDRLRSTVDFWQKEMLRLTDEIKDNYPELYEKYGESLCVTNAGIDGFNKALASGWDEAREFCAVDFPRPKPISGYEAQKDIRSMCSKELKKCAEILIYGSDDHIKDVEHITPAIAAFLELVLKFDEAYSQEKRHRRVADYSDLEHLTLDLLFDRGSCERTHYAHAISKKYKEIMVDEYQDINAVQETIINMVSGGDNNIFMVGDVKQSIYRFRLADPTIFLAKHSSFIEHKGILGNNTGRKIHLSANFRSQAGIINIINHLFAKIMSNELGELDYNENEQLTAGNVRKGKQGKKGKQGAIEEEGKQQAEPEVLIEVIDISGIDNEDDEESPEKTECEAQHVANRIKELVEGSSSLAYSDIVILLRSLKNKAGIYASALINVGVPVDIQENEGFFETIEITAVLSLLEVIDNPKQDIPLAAVLRGQLFNFTADELASVRTVSKRANYYDALIKTAESEVESAEFKEKIKRFLSSINELRDVMYDMPADRFLWHVYNETNILTLFSEMSGGTRRRENLVLLTEYALECEKNGFKGLFGFLTYINGIIKNYGEHKKGSGAHDRGSLLTDAVRILSIHKSKGLEFPVVFLADTAKRFNDNDLKQSVILHTDLGIGVKCKDMTRRIEYTTIIRDAVISKLKQEMLSEEMRVLYVAMTRAREKLIITASYKNAEKEIDKIKKLPGVEHGKISPVVLSGMKSIAEWIITGTQGYKGDDLRITRYNPLIQHQDHEKSVLTKDQADTQKERVTTYKEEEKSKAISCDDCSLSKPDNFKYPYPKAPDIPSKLTVTGLKELEADDDAMVAPYSTPPSSRTSLFTYSKPSFISKKSGLSASERGEALHTAMQHIEPEMCSCDDNVREALQTLVKKGVMLPEQADAVDVRLITRFYSSDTGKRISEAKEIKREFKFSVLDPAEQYFPGGGEDKILLQGVVDCYFEEANEIVVVDFKTDKVSHETADDRARYYSPQIEAYAKALERITGKRVKERIIYFFAIEKSYSSG